MISNIIAHPIWTNLSGNYSVFPRIHLKGILAATFQVGLDSWKVGSVSSRLHWQELNRLLFQDLLFKSEMCTMPSCMLSNERVEATDSWDPEQRTLISEAQYYPVNLREVSISLRVGKISVEGIKDAPPKLTTRLIVSAASEDEAKEYLKTWQDNIKVGGVAGKLSVSEVCDTRPGTVSVNIKKSGGGITVSGDLRGSIFVDGNEVWINGKKVDVTGWVVTTPGIEREIILTVPKQDYLEYDLSAQAGSIQINNIMGKAKTYGQSTDVNIGEFTGNLEVSSQSGNLTLTNIEGELSVASQSGYVYAEYYRGRAEVSTQSGEIRFDRSIFNDGKSALKTMSGNIRVETLSPLQVLASTMSGRIKPECIPGFTVVSMNKRKFGNRIEGYFGSRPVENSLVLDTMSGNILLSPGDEQTFSPGGH